MHVNFPYQFGPLGRTAVTSDAHHVRNLIEQVLFASPGERVNRPTFGCGLRQLVFAPNSPELAATTQFIVQGALQQWLGEVITVESVEVAGEDSALRVTIVYVTNRTQQRERAEFSTGGAG